MTSRPVRLWQRWIGFWLAPGAPTDLAICRIAFYGGLLLLYREERFSPWMTVSRCFWTPTFFFRRLHIPALPGRLILVLEVSWKLLLGLSCLGWQTRVSTLGSFIIGGYLLGLRNNFGVIQHSDSPPVLVLGIMALSRCGDAWSVDHPPRRCPDRGAPTSSSSKASGEYTWPIRVVWLTLSLVFFGAGISKLRRGLGWITSDHLPIQFIGVHYQLRARGVTAWGLRLAQHRHLCRLLAGLTVMLETGYPLALVTARARWIVVPGACALLVAIRAIMGPSFWQLVVCHVFWVPWSSVGRLLAHRLRLGGPRRRPDDSVVTT